MEKPSEYGQQSKKPTNTKIVQSIAKPKLVAKPLGEPNKLKLAETKTGNIKEEKKTTTTLV